jgi:UDPglucose 6-dehydrogenase
MDFSIIGIGYVGLVTGTCLAEKGHNAIFVDIDLDKIDKINDSISPLFEKDLEKLLQKNKDRIRATDSYEQAIQNSDITFICVGTPSEKNGEIDLSFVKTAVKKTSSQLKKKDAYHTIVIKSTVVPGTTKEMILPLIEQESQRTVGVDVGLAMNPEFLKEGVAVDDFMNPDRIVIGHYDNRSKRLLDQLYNEFDCPIVYTTLTAAELIKYTSNAFLATKISFANEIGNICKKLNIDTDEIFKGVGLDPRINPHFFRSGIGFGGSCFPKDVKALIQKAKQLNLETYLLPAVMKVNDEQPKKMIELLKQHTSIENKSIGVLGLSFKPETDDIRESRSIAIVEALIKNNAKVIAYDPKATDHFKELFPQITYADTADDILNADAILITVEWDEFNNLDYTNKMVIDGRKIAQAQKQAKIYDGICW